MTVGALLAQARRSLGLSHEEIAVRTKITVEKLEAIEGDEFDRLPPPVYVKGYVRAYAAEVGLDPDEMAHRYAAQADEMARLARGAEAAPRVVSLEGAESLEAFGSERARPAAPPPAPATGRGQLLDDLILSRPDETFTAPRPVRSARPRVAPRRSRSAPLLIAAGLAIVAGPRLPERAGALALALERRVPRRASCGRAARGSAAPR